MLYRIAFPEVVQIELVPFEKKPQTAQWSNAKLATRGGVSGVSKGYKGMKIRTTILATAKPLGALHFADATWQLLPAIEPPARPSGRGFLFTLDRALTLIKTLRGCPVPSWGRSAPCAKMESNDPKGVITFIVDAERIFVTFVERRWILMNCMNAGRKHFLTGTKIIRLLCPYRTQAYTFFQQADTITEAIKNYFLRWTYLAAAAVANDRHDALWDSR
jgi:hypothetical protein